MSKDENPKLHYKCKLDWFSVFWVRMTIHRETSRGTRKSGLTRSQIVDKLYEEFGIWVGIGTVDKVLYNNANWFDENWDRTSKSYIGRPTGWQEEWGTWY